MGVIAAGNFSLTAALLLRFALLAAEHVPQWEVLDYASFTKPDVPSGTARELAERLGEVRNPKHGVPIEKLHGPKETRGAEIARGVGDDGPAPPGKVVRQDAGRVRSCGAPTWMPVARSNRESRGGAPPLAMIASPAM